MNNPKRRLNVPILFVILLLSILLPAVSAFAGPSRDWPTWSGPNLDMTAESESLFSSGPFGLKTLWTRDLGSAYSGLVVADGRVLTAFANDDHDYVAAFATDTGKELWRYRIGATYNGHDGSDDGPLSTPTVSGGRVFGLGPWGDLFALDLETGRELWTDHIEKKHGAQAPPFGYTTQPTLAGNVLIVQIGAGEGRAVSGFDPATGRHLWSAGDGRVRYQSPLAVEVAGRSQVFTATDDWITGIDPNSGKVLWRIEATEGSSSSVRPIPLGEGRVLVTDRPHSTLYQLSRQGEDHGVRQLWQSRRLRGTYAVPVLHDGHLYGYASNILSCVDAATGELVWRSREPGAGYLALVDDHLVIQTHDGYLVAAEASPEGFREKARVEVVTSSRYFAPVFADGRFFVRSFDRLASVGVTDGRAPVAAADEEPAYEPRGMMAELAVQVASADDKARVIDTWMAARDSFPVVEGDRLVHFVFRGQVEDLVLGGTFLLDGRPRPMHRLPGTNFHVYSVELEPASHYTYYFNEFDDLRLDPLNPRMAYGIRGERNELTTPGWRRPSHMNEPTGARGRVEEFTWKSQHFGEREAQVYLPPAYDGGDERYPVLLFTLGTLLAQRAGLAGSLDNLMASDEAPGLIAVFLPWVPTDNQYPEFAQALVKEVLPHIDEKYRTLKGARNRAIAGLTSGSPAAIYTAIRHPDIFGGVSVQSFNFGQQGGELKALIADGRRRDLALYVTISKLGRGGTLEDSRELVKLLTEGGYRPRVDEVGDGEGWSSWGSRTDRIVNVLFDRVE